MTLPTNKTFLQLCTYKILGTLTLEHSKSAKGLSAMGEGLCCFVVVIVFFTCHIQWHKEF